MLPYSRSSFERVAHEVAELHAVVRDVAEDKLINAYFVPKKARSVALSLDRVAVPMEERTRTHAPWGDLEPLRRRTPSIASGTWLSSRR